MHRRIAALAVTACAATALLLGSASTASAVPPGFYVRSHHASLAECEAAGQAGGDIWGRCTSAPRSRARPASTSCGCATDPTGNGSGRSSIRPPSRS